MQDHAVTARIPVLWGDMDAFGHVNNARYFTWFETARIEYLRELGLATEGTPDLGPILAHTSCDFLAPVRWPAQIVVGARVSKVGNTSFVMEYQAAIESEPPRVVARGKGVIVLFNYRTGEKVAIPDAMRTRIEQLG
jgi:acyl-CoA thioester hydrolase